MTNNIFATHTTVHCLKLGIDKPTCPEAPMAFILVVVHVQNILGSISRISLLDIHQHLPELIPVLAPYIVVPVDERHNITHREHHIHRERQVIEGGVQGSSHRIGRQHREIIIIEMDKHCESQIYVDHVIEITIHKINFFPPAGPFGLNMEHFWAAAFFCFVLTLEKIIVRYSIIL
jgi:hypothetical protein